MIRWYIAILESFQSYFHPKIDLSVEGIMRIIRAAGAGRGPLGAQQAHTEG